MLQRTEEMPVPEPPRTDVLAERIEALSGQVRDAVRRMDGLATQQGLADLIRGRDELYNTRITHLSDDLNELTAALATERAERRAADVENEARANRARMFALSAIGVTVTVFLGIVGLIAQLGGAPT